MTVAATPNVLDTLAAKVLLKDGAYIAVVADFKPKLLEDHKYGREAIRFTLKIVEGDSKGRLATLSHSGLRASASSRRPRH